MHSSPKHRASPLKGAGEHNCDCTGTRKALCFFGTAFMAVTRWPDSYPNKKWDHIMKKKMLSGSTRMTTWFKKRKAHGTAVSAIIITGHGSAARQPISTIVIGTINAALWPLSKSCSIVCSTVVQQCIGWVASVLHLAEMQNGNSQDLKEQENPFTFILSCCTLLWRRMQLRAHTEVCVLTQLWLVFSHMQYKIIF